MGKVKKTISLLMTLAVMMACIYIPAYESKAAGSSLSGAAHVQTYGDTSGTVTKENGTETLVLGTRGESKRVESVTISFTNNTGYSGSLQYRVHRQTYGWTNWVQSGSPAGTTGESKRLEAIEIRLTGELAKHYDVRYAAHAQTYGDNQGWVYNGALAGTTGEAKRLEEIKVQIIPKNTYNEQISYRVHRQTYGWESMWSYDGMVSGTTGQAKRLEGITIDLKGNQYSGGVTYRTHVQSYGWLDWVSDGEMSGTQGEAKRLEAIEIKLTGDMAAKYDVYYRVHAQHFGWMGWVSNGAPAGTSGYGYRLEAIQIVLVKKGAAAPSASYGGADQDSASGYSNREDASGAPADEKRVWHDARYSTVTVVKCSDCQAEFKNETEFKKHLIEYDDDQCNESSGSSVKQYTFCVQDGYYEYTGQGKTFVPTEYKPVWLVTDAGWTEKNVPVYEIREYAKCNQCKKKFYAPAYYIEKYGYYDENDPEMSISMHLKYTDCYSYSGGYSEQVQVGSRDVEHPELGHWENQKVKEGYWR